MGEERKFVCISFVSEVLQASLVELTKVGWDKTASTWRTAKSRDRQFVLHRTTQRQLLSILFAYWKQGKLISLLIVTHPKTPPPSSKTS